MRRADPWLHGEPIWNDQWYLLARQVFTGARDGNPRPEAAFDLGVFLKDWAKPHPVFDSLAEASIGAIEQGTLEGLAREALAVVDYAPDFRAEPALLDVLSRMLVVAARDLLATGLTGLSRLHLPDDANMQNVWVQYQLSLGHTSGITPRDATEGGPDLLRLIADELQEAVMEALSGAWPVCPQHQLGAHPRVLQGQAVWLCQAGRHVIAAIGAWSD